MGLDGAPRASWLTAAHCASRPLSGASVRPFVLSSPRALCAAASWASTLVQAFLLGGRGSCGPRKRTQSLWKTFVIGQADHSGERAAGEVLSFLSCRRGSEAETGSGDGKGP